MRSNSRLLGNRTYPSCSKFWEWRKSLSPQAIFKADLAGLLDRQLALVDAAFRSDLDEAGLEAADGVEIGADLVEIGFLLVAIGLVQALRRLLARAAEKGDGQQSGEAEARTAHQEDSHGKMEKFGRPARLFAVKRGAR